MDEYKLVKKYLNKSKANNKKTVIPFVFLNKILLSSILLLVCLCIFKENDSFKKWVHKNVYETNFSFSSINKTYEKYFGSIFPLPEIPDNVTEPVFNEELIYSKKEAYKDGVKLTVSKNYLVPVMESGIVVYMGNKDNYGYTIIVQQVNGIDLWYVGVDNSNLKMYDYIEKGSFLGEAKDTEIYLYYQKQGEFINYKEYLG